MNYLDEQQEAIHETFKEAKVAGQAISATASAINAIKSSTRRRKQWFYCREESIREWMKANDFRGSVADAARAMVDRPKAVVRNKWWIEPSRDSDRRVRDYAGVSRYAKVVRKGNRVAVYMGSPPPWFKPMAIHRGLYTATGAFFFGVTLLCLGLHVVHAHVIAAINIVILALLAIIANARAHALKVYHPGDEDPFTNNTYAVWLLDGEPDSEPEFY